MAALKSLGLDSFEALSVGQADLGPQVAFVPLDESSMDAAQAIAALPDLVRALGIDSCAAALWDVERDRSGGADPAEATITSSVSDRSTPG